MAELQINEVVSKFQDEIGRLSGQVIIANLQTEAVQKELTEQLQVARTRAENFRLLLDEHGIDYSALTRQDPITTVDQAVQVAERLSETPDGDQPAPPSRPQKRSQGRRP